MKIMIVDDHAEVRRFLRSMLEQAGREFVECADGLEAEQAFRRVQPDWTIMDIAMKGLNGIEATRRIRRNSPAARILILTQHDSPAVRRAAQQAGAWAFLTKDHLEQIEGVLTSA